MSYDLQKLYSNDKSFCNHDQYIDKRPFSNIILDITVLEEKKMDPGDKASNRYGGKGVISEIWPQTKMPRFKNEKGEYEYVDIIFNLSTMINRENAGQNFELSLTHIGSEILKTISAGNVSLEDAYAMVHRYISLCSPQQAEYLEQSRKSMSREELMFLMESIIDSGAIHLSMRPLSDTMTIDKLADIYDQFPWIQQTEIEVPMAKSDGTLRYVKARRKVVVGKQYIFRLKQFAEEKFSATSLSATNIRNENTKSRAKKDFRELYPNTPIRFGNMETNNMNHLGPDVVIGNLMIHSVSPQGRRLAEQMYTGDPFKIDIKLDSDSKNRSAEIANTYLKTVGRRLKFIKKRKKIEKILMSPIVFEKDPYIKPIEFVSQQEREKITDWNAEFEERQRIEQLRASAISPIEFEGVTRKKNGERKW